MELRINKENWTPVKLGDVFTKREENDKENARNRFDRFLKVEHFDKESLHVKRWASQENGDELNPTFYKIFRKGQILFPTRNPHLRRTVLAPFDGICGEKTLTLEPDDELILPEFMPFLFHSESFYAHTTGAIIGSTNPHCRWRDVANYEFLLPPKDQQAQLAKLLWAMDEVIESLIETNEKLQSSYITIIEKELLNRKANKLHFGDILDVIRGVGYKPAQLLDEYNSNCCIVLRSNNISNGLINFNEIRIVPNKLIKESQFLIDGDFAICMSNGSKELVGKCAEFRTNKKNVSIGSFCAGLRPKNEKYRQLLRHLVNSESYRVAIKRTLSGSAINNLKPSDIEGLFLRVNLNTSESILEKLDSMINNRLKLDESISTSKSLQKSLINQVF